MKGRVPLDESRWEQERALTHGQPSAQESEAGGGETVRGGWKGKVEFEQEAAFCEVPYRPLFLGYQQLGLDSLNSKM